MHFKELLNFFIPATKKNENKEIRELIPFIRRIYPVLVTYLESTDTRNKQTDEERFEDYDSTGVKLLQNYFKGSVYRNKQMDVVEDIRYIILDVLKNEKKHSLKYYHSVLHLVFLINKKGMKLHVKLREWLNINFKTELMSVDLMRGNFDRITFVYPQLNEAFSEFYQNDKVLFEQSLERGSDDVGMNKIEVCDVEKDNKKRHSEWKERHSSIFPRQFKKILLGRVDDQYLFWGDKLLYQLLFVKRDKEYELRDLKDILSEDNIYVDLLTGNYEEAFFKADKLLKIILLFVLPESFSKGRLQACDTLLIDLGRIISERDTLFSLNIFKFTSRFNHYYSYISNNIKINDKIAKQMLDFATGNNLNYDVVMNKWIEFSIETNNFINAFNIMKQYSIRSVKMDFSSKEIIHFCLNNYEEVLEVLENLKMEEGQKDFIVLLHKINVDLEINEEEVGKVLRSPTVVHFMDLIFTKLCAMDLSDDSLLKMLKVVVTVEKQGTDIKKYKKMVVDKFYN